jgi:hypothetical protein
MIDFFFRGNRTLNVSVVMVKGFEKKLKGVYAKVAESGRHSSPRNIGAVILRENQARFHLAELTCQSNPPPPLRVPRQDPARHTPPPPTPAPCDRGEGGGGEEPARPARAS